MNIWDILILLAVGALVLLALRAMRRGRKKGCGCGCADCGKDCPSRRSDSDKEDKT